MSKIKVAEIFGPTIQGEGPNVGVKCIFVRVCHCDFNCSWCDSKFAWKEDDRTTTYESVELSNYLLQLCENTNTAHVILTGGNPCIYDFTDVIDTLHRNNIHVDVETQGSLYPEWLKKVDILVISPKAPSSEQKDVLQQVKAYLDGNNNNSTIAIKIPVFNDDDFKFATSYHNMIETLNNDKIKFYLSVGNTDTKEAGDISTRVLTDYEKLIEKVCNSEMKNVYILPQVHTLVWGNKQGV